METTLQRIELKRNPDYGDHRKWKKQRARIDHADRTVESGVQAFDADSGEHIFTFLTMPEEHPVGPLLEALRGLHFISSYRTDGLLSYSCTFGFAPRVALRRDFCGCADSAIRTPKEHAVLIDYGRASARLYEKHLPAQFASQLAMLEEKVLPFWREPGVHFTSGIANNKNILAYHRDAGNFPDALSSMYTITRDMGRESGMLVIPEYSAALAFSGFELLIFNGAKYMHGVTPIHSLNANALRYSVVYYPLKAMAVCGTPEEELTRIRDLKTHRANRRLSSNKDLLLHELADGLTVEEVAERGKRHHALFQRVKRKVPGT
jgi:hypothetical protein